MNKKVNGRIVIWRKEEKVNGGGKRRTEKGDREETKIGVTNEMNCLRSLLSFLLDHLDRCCCGSLNEK